MSGFLSNAAVMFFKVNPESCGRFGRKTLYGGELTDRPPQIYRLHFEFDKMSTTELVGINCTFLGTVALMQRIKALDPRATGIFFDEVATTTSPEFRKDFPGQDPPEYKWFKINGKARVDDFGMSPEFDLIVSDRIFALL